MGDEASVMGGDSTSKARVKKPSYWLGVLTLDGAFCGRKYVRELDWAEACVDRETRNGNGMAVEAISSTSYQDLD